MTTSHGRRIQGRRALAIMAWASLVIVAGLLWYGQEEDVIRIQAWEPAALLLSAYSAFLAIFGWLLFAPERKSAEESPALFFSGMLTLIPPCFIAYHLMPPSSPLRGWLTLGVFVFGLFAILSPLPAEVFAVPRDRKSYLQPLTDSYLSVLDVEERPLDLQSLVPRSYYSLTTPDVARSPATPGSTARDPWTDPFYGTGRAMSEVGSARRSTYSESRSHGSDRRSESAHVRESAVRESSHDAAAHDQRYGDSESLGRTLVVDRDRSLPQSRETQRATGLGYTVPRISVPPVPPMPPAIPSDPVVPTNSGVTRPPMTARSAFAPRESRAPNYQPQSTAPVTSIAESGVSGSIQPIATSASTTATRRPLTEPGTRIAAPVGFQTPPASRPVTLSPPPMRWEQPVRPAAPVAGPSLGSGTIAATTPPASAASYDDVLKSAVSEFRSITDPAPHTARPQETTRPLLETEPGTSETRPAIDQYSRAAETDLRELDRRIREQEADDEQDENLEGDSAMPSAMSPAARTSPLNDVKMERLKDELGGEMIDGTIRVFFEVGQKRAHLHVPFSPPLAGLPEVECEAVSDSSALQSRSPPAVWHPY
ncbi:MAG: hypothetical protein WKF77_13520 [Planctomycetaceae bacterium]